jgi:hypothetical protein
MKKTFHSNNKTPPLYTGKKGVYDLLIGQLVEGIEVLA